MRVPRRTFTSFLLVVAATTHCLGQAAFLNPSIEENAPSHNASGPSGNDVSQITGGKPGGKYYGGSICIALACGAPSLPSPSDFFKEATADLSPLSPAVPSSSIGSAWQSYKASPAPLPSDAATGVTQFLPYSFRLAMQP
jgi:hypothetical protein